jgi:uncharacterized membrane protein YhaH (DUF805 family)
MKFFDAVRICFVKYTDFSGRASRSEFWLFILFTLISDVILLILDTSYTQEVTFWGSYDYTSPLSNAFCVAVLIPSISVTVRRLHDVNKSGWWFISAFTIIGILFPILYWCCNKGDEGENRFGPKSLA